jgi:LCP family protein required for cell wall assembly
LQFIMPQVQQSPRRDIPAGQPGITSAEKSIESFQPIRIGRVTKKKKNRRLKWIFGGLLVVFMVYFFAPLRTNLMLLGIDRAPDGTSLGRSDTIVLMTVVPLAPYVGMMSVPRDLWVPIEGVGENRINTVHFFAEANKPGSGPAALRKNIQENFSVRIPYYVRIKFDGLVDFVDAMGGVTITTTKPSTLFDAGTHHLNGEQALAFVRDRKGADDFSRMANAQLFIEAAVIQAVRPASWPRLPVVMVATLQVVDSNIPIWQFPRLGFAFLRALIFGIDARTFTREMATPFATSEGASVLLPDWELINPAMREMFGGW